MEHVGLRLDHFPYTLVGTPSRWLSLGEARKGGSLRTQATQEG